MVENERSRRVGFSAINITAALSIVVLIGALFWRGESLIAETGGGLPIVAGAAAAGHSAIPDNNPSADYSSLENATGTDPFAPSQITQSAENALAYDYAALQQNGQYSSTTAAQVAQELGANLKADVSYKKYSPGEIPTGSNTSYDAMMAYRASLQTSLQPLLKNTTPEIDMLTNYIQTNDPSYLTELAQAADNYKLAAAQTAQVTVPQDAVAVQIGILNAMDEFAATLDQMAANAKDPFAEDALVNTYMQAQTDMFTSFNNLYTYYKSKQQSKQQ